jgi:hypothetical protein
MNRPCTLVIIVAAACTTAGAPKERASATPPNAAIAEGLKPYDGVQSLVQLSHGGVAFNDFRDPYVDFTVHVFRDGAVLYGMEPCPTPAGIRRRQLDADEFGAVQRLLIRYCDALQPDEPRLQCEDAAYLAVRCQGGNGSRRLNLTCQYRRGTAAWDFVEGLLRLVRLGSTHNKASKACPLIAGDPIVAPMRDLAHLEDGSAPPRMMMEAELGESRGPN